MDNNRKREEEEDTRQATLLSETDIFGSIIFVNDDFCRISGYRAEELIGKPHNIIRHPDMPAELFRQLWLTIKSGDVFRGVIKNRTKSGLHYWVNATIMPVLDSNEKIVKYIGARYHIHDEALARMLYSDQAKRLNLKRAGI